MAEIDATLKAAIEAIEAGLDVISDARGWGTYPRMGSGVYADAMAFKEKAEPTLRALRDALTRPSDAGVVKVKALEWRELTDDRGDGTREPNGNWEAETPFGFYEIELVPPVWGLVFHGNEEPYIGGDRASPDEAKAAAREDYEQRILSALTAEPQAEAGERE